MAGFVWCIAFGVAEILLWPRLLTQLLFSSAAPLQKAETGLCGFPVQPAGREILTKLYENILAKLGEMEASAPYRVHMTRILNHRLDILRTTENILDIEAKIEDGQIEELIDDAEDELNMLPSYIESKMWQAPNKWHTIPVTWSNLKD